ncbi:MAG: MBOAT family protein [Oscillospiraceae bacterium]|nr:MBOAT family protein [Oscillospiraceae bacterium]
MVFADLFFLYGFLPLNLICYFVTKSLTIRNLVLIAFSLFFYAWGEPVWILLLLISSGVDFINGKIIERYRGTIYAKISLIASVVINLSLLAVFKYSGFLVDSLNGLLGLSLPVPTFALPIGISFYTFQTMSYSIDVYRGETKAQQSFFKFLLFVSLFHQLVAGPIVRYSHIAKQIDDRTTTPSQFYDGLSRFIMGLAKKVIIANYAGELSQNYLGADLSTLAVSGAWFGIMLFSLQIYYDFSGYSDMAIGLGKMVGFTYRENFIYPYISKSVSEFWNRWHVSLGSFFKDYVYIPLGGKKKNRFLNLFIVWALTGLWHGASWNFVLWGLYFFVFIAVEKMFLLKLFEKIPQIFSHIYLLFVVVVGWAIFYFTDISELWQFVKILFGATENVVFDQMVYVNFMNNIWWFIVAIIGCVPLAPLAQSFATIITRRNEQIGYVTGGLHITANVVLLLLCTVLLAKQSFNPFLYFRF